MARVLPGSLPSPPSEADERAFVEALQRRERSAEVRFYDRYSDLVERIIARIVGVDDELPDLIHEAFVRGLKAIGSLRDPAAITTWVTQVAVSTATDALRRRQTRRRWFSFVAPAPPDVPVLEDIEGAMDARAALRWIYEVLRTLPAEERSAFALRRLEGRELGDVAIACRCSLATVKRRIARAEKTFAALSAKNPVLSEWLSEKGGSS